ncbi:hypothetical protein JCM19300_743 [Algibacter lectus]|uniref:Uncharacterized protein n=1 Tax=Algibacter lectus TaxID=221126 RepID=A0A090W3B9_9FLAO|nr:hypothetical protein JCM19300_743 [Algibacter lectus]
MKNDIEVIQNVRVETLLKSNKLSVVDFACAKFAIIDNFILTKLSIIT